MPSRRKFLASSGLVSLTPFLSATRTSFQTSAPRSALAMGIAGYTFAHYDVPASIAIMQRVGITALSIKDFHIPMTSTQEQVDKIKTQFTSAGIQIYAAGVIYMKTRDEVDKAFDYVKRVGVDLMIGSPVPELLSYVDQQVKKFNIRLAIHNHGPEDKLYPTPKSVYDQLKAFDSRIGLCIDIGHALRAGADPVQSVFDFRDRLLDMHVKDLSETSSSEKAIPIGRGIIDIPALVSALYKIEYKGRCSVEFERDMTDALPGIAESVGYFRGVVNDQLANQR